MLKVLHEKMDAVRGFDYSEHKIDTTNRRLAPRRSPPAANHVLGLEKDASDRTGKQRFLDNAVVTEGVVDVFALAKLNKPNIGLLSDEFREDVRNIPLRNLAVELLEKLLKDEIRGRMSLNVVQEKACTDRLIETLRRYHNRSIETAQVIEEMIEKG